MSNSIDTTRLDEIMQRDINYGAHRSPKEGMCVMEAVAYVAGEKWTDKPECCCPVIGTFMRSWNDALPTDGERNRLLRPIVPQLVNTRGTSALAERRAYMALDWLVRVHAPAWLDLTPSLSGHAQALRDMDEIADIAGVHAAGATVRAARDAARNAFGDPAWNADWAAAGDLGWAAAGDAAGAAAGAAADVAWNVARNVAREAVGEAARDAARDAAGAAAKDAARDAAGNAVLNTVWNTLRPTKEWLQASAVDLVERMIAAKEPDHESRPCGVAEPPRHESPEKLTPPAPLPYVSRLALKRVKQPVPLPAECPYCDGTPRIVDHAEIYGGRRFGEWPYAVACDSCDAYVGLHPHTDVPLGTLANRELREARKLGKRAFYDLIDIKGWSRSDGYQWLAARLGISVDECHWGWFDVSRCEEAERVCNEEFSG